MIQKIELRSVIECRAQAHSNKWLHSKHSVRTLFTQEGIAVCAVVNKTLPQELLWFHTSSRMRAPVAFRRVPVKGKAAPGCLDADADDGEKGPAADSARGGVGWCYPVPLVQPHHTPGLVCFCLVSRQGFFFHLQRE